MSSSTVVGRGGGGGHCGPYTGPSIIEERLGGPCGLLIDALLKSATAAELKMVSSANSLVGLTERDDAVFRFSKRLCNSSTTAPISLIPVIVKVVMTYTSVP